MQRLTDGEIEILAELNAEAEGLGPEWMAPDERGEYERLFDAEGPADYFAPPAGKVQPFDETELPF